MKEIKYIIESGQAVLGIELGSTRIKAVLIDDQNRPIADGGFSWENQLVDGIWIYELADVETGIQASIRDLKKNVKMKYGTDLKLLRSIGISAMMHGYLVLDKNQQQLAPFRTWRNTITKEEAQELTSLFNYTIPQRWSIAQLYYSVRRQEQHVSMICHMTTLAGYVHWLLTDEWVLGIGDASGIFPIDVKTKTYAPEMVRKFDYLISDRNYPWQLNDILPKVLTAGEEAGRLTERGARFLDPEGSICPGVPLCPPEADGATGMIATNTISRRTGNVSVGTSIFSIIVLEKELSQVYEDFDNMMTPSGECCVLVHCNNGTTELDTWVGVFREFAHSLGCRLSNQELFHLLYNVALEGDVDCGGILSYNHLAGENTLGFQQGRPLLVRKPDDKLNLANFMRSQLYASLAALKIGIDQLISEEDIGIDIMMAHGGLFKTEYVGQKILADAINVPVSVMATAGEGGAYGIALLASYLVQKQEGESLEDYLQKRVFAGMKVQVVRPEEAAAAGFEAFTKKYRSGFPIEQAAIDCLE